MTAEWWSALFTGLAIGIPLGMWLAWIEIVPDLVTGVRAWRRGRR